LLTFGKLVAEIKRVACTYTFMAHSVVTLLKWHSMICNWWCNSG